MACVTYRPTVVGYGAMIDSIPGLPIILFNQRCYGLNIILGNLRFRRLNYSCIAMPDLYQVTAQFAARDRLDVVY